MNFSDSRLWFSREGRINRQPYLLASVVIALAMKALEFASETSPTLQLLSLPAILFGIFVLVAVAVKRSHDLGKSGWFVVLMFIPILNLWPGLLFTFQKGTSGPNAYGEDPLGEAAPSPPAAS